MNYYSFFPILFLCIFLFAVCFKAQERNTQNNEIKLILDGKDLGYGVKALPSYFSNKKKLTVYLNGEKNRIKIKDYQELVFVNLVSNDTLKFYNKKIKSKRYLLKQVAVGKVQILEKYHYNFLAKVATASGFSLALGAITNSNYGFVVGIPLGIVLVEHLIETSTLFVEFEKELIKLMSKEGISILKQVYEEDLDGLDGSAIIDIVNNN